MGVIKSQSIFSTIYAYIGVVVGFVTSALLMPKVFETDQIGFIKLIVAVSGIFASIFSLGISQLLYRMYPVFEQDLSKRRMLLIYSLRVAFFGSLLAVPVYFLFLDDLLNIHTETTDLEKTLLVVIVIFISIVTRIIYTSLFAYTRMMNSIAIDAFIQNVYHKGGIFILVVLFYFDWINYQTFVFLYSGLFFLFPLILLAHTRLKKGVLTTKQARSLNKSETKWFSKSERKEFHRLMFFGLLTSLGGSVYLYLDTLMVNHYLGESEVGIYGTMFLFGVIVIIPARSLKNIAISVLSRAFNENDLESVKQIYQKSSITLLIIGGYIFIGVWSNMYSVFGFLPEDFQLGAYVVLFIGLGQLVDMVAGVNNELLAASTHYRLNTWFIIASIVIGFIVNVLLIPHYGMTGAAIATFLTIFFTNLLRLIAVYRIYNLSPFTWATLKVTVMIVGITLAVELVPNHDNHLISLFVKGTIITIVYLPLIYFMKVSDDVNNIIDSTLKRFGLKRM